MVWRQAPIPCSRQSDSNFLGVGIWLVKAAPVSLYFVCFSESELWVPGIATEGKIWSGKRSWALSDSLMTRIITATANTIIFGFSGAQCIHCVWPKSSGSAWEECGLVDNKRTTDNEQWWCDDQDRASQISVLWCLVVFRPANLTCKTCYLQVVLLVAFELVTLLQSNMSSFSIRWVIKGIDVFNLTASSSEFIDSASDGWVRKIKT